MDIKNEDGSAVPVAPPLFTRGQVEEFMDAVKASVLASYDAHMETSRFEAMVITVGLLSPVRGHFSVTSAVSGYTNEDDCLLALARGINRFKHDMFETEE